MRNLPPGPSVGDKVTAELVRELIRCIRSRQLLRGPGYALKTSPNGTTIQLLGQPQHRTAKPPRPWEIHFFPAATQEDEDFWGVYLPAGSLNVAGEEVTPTDETGAALAAAGAAYPGYYVIPVASGTSPSAFWLHVYTSEGTGGTSYRATVGASATANAGSGEETLTSIRLCSIASSGAITQLIVGAITLGGGGGGGSGGGEYPTVEYPTIIVQSVAMTPVDSSDPHYDSSHVGSIEISRGYLEIGDGQDGTTEGELYVENDPYLTQYIETVPISDVVDSNVLSYEE